MSCSVHENELENLDVERKQSTLEHSDIEEQFVRVVEFAEKYQTKNQNVTLGPLKLY